MKTNIQAVNFEMAERLEQHIAKKTRRYEKLLNNPSAVMDIKMTLVKPETNLNKHAQIRITGNGPEMFAEKTCDTFEEAIDLSLEALDRQIEKLKDK